MGGGGGGDEAASVKKWDKKECCLNCLKMKKYYKDAVLTTKDLV